MDYFHVFVLTSLDLDKSGVVKSRNVAVTFDLFEAEDHRNEGVENDYDVFVVPCDWQEDAAQSELVAAMREFREVVKRLRDEALR
jgi:exonuclease VII large subunit